MLKEIKFDALLLWQSSYKFCKAPYHFWTYVSSNKNQNILIATQSDYHSGQSFN